MKKVNPIKDPEKIEEMKLILKKQNYRDYILFEMGINIGLRITDLLQLKVKDVKDKHEINIKEGSINKSKTFPINSRVKTIIDEYIINMTNDEYLFQSRKGQNKPISSVQAYRVLKKAAEKIDLDKVGTHTLRKTFGYHYYKKTKDVEFLQRLFNHNSPSFTLDYIGIQQQEINKKV